MFKLKKLRFGRKPKKHKSVKVWKTKKEKSWSIEKKPKYQYSIVQSKQQRLHTYSTREDAIMALNRLRETQPGAKYHLVVEKKPNMW